MIFFNNATGRTGYYNSYRRTRSFPQSTGSKIKTPGNETEPFVYCFRLQRKERPKQFNDNQVVNCGGVK